SSRGFVLRDEPSSLVRDVHRAEAPAGPGNRDVHDRADTEAFDELVIGERVAYLVGRARDEHLTAVEHRAAPGCASLHLAPAHRIGGGVAAVDALDLVGRREYAHQREQPVPDDVLYEGVDGGVK